MEHNFNQMDEKIKQIASRIKELRLITGLSVKEMAERTGLSESEYEQCEAGNRNLSIAFLYHCTLSFGVDMGDILEGKSPKLRSYALTRKGDGQRIEEAHNMVGFNLAADFRNRIALPLYMELNYREDAEIELVTHEGQECDIVISGQMQIKIGPHTETLGPGDCIYYDSGTPHGMRAVGGEDCSFYAIVLRNQAAREGEDGTERKFTFQDMKKESARVANYFKSLGIKRGDRVMLVLKRHYQFWFSILALHKIGAIAIPAPNQLLEKDFEYRFNMGKVKAIVCTSDGEVANSVDSAAAKCPGLERKIIVGGSREGWHSFDEEYSIYSSHFARTEDAPAGSDPMLMFFTSGTSGYPKIAAHSYKYPLGHFITAKYWHQVNPEGLHFTISDTGWAKALWGKLYGQWLCEAATFVYDFDRFDAEKILPLFKKHNITTFCAPPTM